MAVPWALVFAVLSCHRAAALFHTSHKQDDGIVCISLPVYEDESWIDTLLKNALFFSEPSTRIVLHLNAYSNYTERQIAKWETDRVTVAAKRVYTKAFRGSLLYAQMSAASHLDTRWPVGSKEKPCDYWVYQSSNMMWVRRGMEDDVRKSKYGMIAEYPFPRLCSKDQPLIQVLSSKSGRYGWGRPESSFYPMDTVRKFLGELNKFLVSIGNDESKITEAKCFLEEFALQTYVLNYENVSDEEVERLKRKMHTWAHYNNQIPKEQDTVPMSEVKSIAQQEKGWEQYYAVKRVNRDPEHPVTKYILSLAN